MRTTLISLTFAVLTVSIICWLFPPQVSTQSQNIAPSGHTDELEGKALGEARMQNDWFMRQRRYPFERISSKYYLEAIDRSRSMRRALPRTAASQSTWECIGPNNVPGRISDLAVSPDNRDIVYAATASGGVFKSVDQGQSWSCITDDLGLTSVGAVTVDPTNADVIYVGTGEANVRNYSYEGSGMYKSNDAGLTWSHIGLEGSGRIARIVIDPEHPDTLYVAALGPYYGDTYSEYGVYRSFDGGANWEKVLGDHGCIDITFRAGGVLLAALWEVPYGPGSGVYRSADYGDTWIRLGPDQGLPSATIDANRIGLTMDPRTGIAYALYAASDGSFHELYRSMDTGATWTDMNASDLEMLNAGHRYGWYFGQIRVAPNYPQYVFAGGLDGWRSVTGGAYWTVMKQEYLPPGGTNMHVDQHAMWIDPDDPNFMYAGNDGGVYKSTDMGDYWEKLLGFPCTQFYAVTFDYQYPERRFGGTQDNGTNGSFFESPDNWLHVGCCDGFVPVVDYSDSCFAYCESQWGRIYRSINGGHDFSSANAGIPYTEDGGWKTPLVIHPRNPRILFTGTNRIYRTTNRAELWVKFSPALTPFTITTIAVAPSSPDVVYAGTEDAQVWVTVDGGDNWTYIAYSLPERWVTSIAVDPFDAGIAYVTHSGYRDAGIDLYPDPPPNAGELQPYVSRTTDFGQTWTDITGDLPQAPVNDIIVDNHSTSHLVVGNDVGVFETFDLGQSWTPVGQGLPITVIMDIDFHPPTRALLAGTHGRSAYQTILPCPDSVDSDLDGVPDACDACPGADDSQDADHDFVPDGCDLCPGMSDNADSDGDGMPDACDVCDGGDDFVDPDDDGVPSDCDNCPALANPGQEDINGNDIGDACESCCGFWSEGLTGNVDCSADGKITLSDISRLIDRVYISKAALCCESAGNVNGSADCLISLSDITALIDGVYISKVPTKPCMPGCDI